MENAMHTKSSAIGMLAKYYANAMTPELADVFNEVLAPYTNEEVAAACRAYMSDPEPPQWMPTPGQIAKRIEEARGKAHVRALRQQEAADAAEGWDGYFAEIRKRDLLEWQSIKKLPQERIAVLYLDECVRPSQRRAAVEAAFKDGKIKQEDRDAIIARLDAELSRKRAKGLRITEVPFRPCAAVSAG